MIRLVENDRKGDLTLFDSEGLPGQYTWKLDQALGRDDIHYVYTGPFPPNRLRFSSRHEQDTAVLINIYLV